MDKNTKIEYDSLHNLAMKRLHLCIAGQVQGVLFRSFVYDKAHGFGLVGWVRNTADGVDVLAEGEEMGLRQLLAQCQHGPRWAVVRNVEAEWQDIPETSFRSFEIR